MIIESELRAQIAKALVGLSSLDDLYDWLMDRSWNMHRDSAPQSVELASSVELLFFERSSGDISDAQARARLSTLFNNVTATIVIGKSASLRINSRPVMIGKLLSTLSGSPLPGFESQYGASDSMQLLSAVAL